VGFFERLRMEKLMVKVGKSGVRILERVLKKLKRNEWDGKNRM
jgi:hypothetical protein